VGADAFWRELQFEAKNWGSYKVGPEVVREEVLPRFTGGIPVLVISSLARWTSEARELLAERGILVLEIGFVVTPRNIGRAVAILKRKLALIFNITGLRFLQKFRYLLARPVRLAACSPGSRVVGSGELMPRGGANLGPPDLTSGRGCRSKRPVGNPHFMIALGRRWRQVEQKDADDFEISARTRWARGKAEVYTPRR